MTETPARKPRPRRTFSAFGDVRKMPSEYEIVTHKQNWTLRANRAAAFEQNPSSAPNLWFLTYRDNSPLQASDWDAYRDPDALTYKAYVGLQSEAEAKVAGVLEAHADAGSDAALSPGSVALLGHLLTPSRYLCHGFQQVEAYVGYMAPSSYITNAAGFSPPTSCAGSPRSPTAPGSCRSAGPTRVSAPRSGRCGRATPAGSRPARRWSTRWSATTGGRRSRR